MEATGIIRKIDDLGRIVIPKEIRNSMGIIEGTPLEILKEGEAIVLKKYTPETDILSRIEGLESEINNIKLNAGDKRTITHSLNSIKLILKTS